MPVESRNDPACGMDIAPREAAGTSQFGAWLYYFRSARCKDDVDRVRVQHLLIEIADAGPSPIPA